MKKFEIELINTATIVVEVEAETLEEAEKIAMQKRRDLDFNAYNEDCVRVFDNDLESGNWLSLCCKKPK